MKYLAIIGFVGASAASCILANSAANAGGLLDDVLRRVGASYAASAHRVPGPAVLATPQAHRVPRPPGPPVPQATPQAHRLPAVPPPEQATPQARRLPAVPPPEQATPQGPPRGVPGLVRR
jgi:hypothetical protein